MLYLLADKGTTPTGSFVWPAMPAPSRSSRAGATASAPSLRQKPLRRRHLIENAFCRLKDFRRVATGYDKLAANFLCGVGPRYRSRVLAMTALKSEGRS